MYGVVKSSLYYDLHVNLFISPSIAELVTYCEIISLESLNKFSFLTKKLSWFPRESNF